MKYRHAVLGGTGHVGTILVNYLISKKQPVMIIGHSPDKAEEWIKKGAVYRIADSQDTEKLHELFRQSERLFILNPPAPPATDTVKEETKSVQAILLALKGLHLEKVVAASTYGAQRGDDIADLGTLYELEQGLSALPTPFAIIRSAYYMSNWDAALESVKKDGILPTLYPVDFKLPMVAPADVGAFAAELMLNDITGLYFIEGPTLYSPADVAATLGSILNKPVKAITIPEEQWLSSLQQNGFSFRAAAYMANMSRLVLKEKLRPINPYRGLTTIQGYFDKLML